MKALLIVIIVLTVIALLPLGIDGGYGNGVFSIHVRCGPVSFGIPSKKKKKKKPPKGKKGKKTDESGKAVKKKKRFDKRKLSGIIKETLKTLGRLRRKLSVDYLRFHYCFASGDPAKTAIGFGIANAAAGAFIPLLDNAFKIKERDFGFSCDFLSEKPAVDVWITATLRVWEIIYIAAALGIDYLKIKIRQKRENRANERNESNGKTSDR